MSEKSKEKRVHDVFENIYENYDTMNSVISFQRHKAWRKDIMQRMDVKEGSNALDVCCGTGDWSFALADAVGSQGDVIGLDFSKNMLSVAEKRLQAKEQEQPLQFIHGNAMELPFESNS